jgi:hypothetical protein
MSDKTGRQNATIGPTRMFTVAVWVLFVVVLFRSPPYVAANFGSIDLDVKARSRLERRGARSTTLDLI